MNKKLSQNKTAIIISGPSSSGKSSLMKNNELTKELINCLKFYDIYDKKYFKGKFSILSETDNRLKLKKNNIIYHYDFIKNLTIFTKKYKYLDEIIDSFEKIIVVICVCSTEKLRKRFTLMENIRRRRYPIKKYLRPLSLFNFFRISNYYKNSDYVYENYSRWLNYLKNQNTEVILYNTNNGFFIYEKKNKIDSIIRSVVYGYI